MGTDMNIDPTHLAALALGIVPGALIVYAACPTKRTEPADPECRDLLEEWWQENMPKYRDMMDTLKAERESRVLSEETPTTGTLPRALPTPSTPGRLRTWSAGGDLIEELPDDAKRLDEGLVTIDVGSRTHQHIMKLKGLHKDPVYLTVDGANGQWVGRLFSTHWNRHNLITFDAQFEPDHLGPGRAAWSA